MKTLAILILLGAINLSLAQDNEAINDIKKISQRYIKLTEYAMNFQVTMKGKKTNKPVINQKGTVIHTNQLHYVNYGGNITLIKNNQFISVNHANKLVVYNEGEKQKNSSAQNMDLSGLLDSLFSQTAQFNYSYLPAKEGQKKIFVEDTKRGLYEAYAITFDASSYRLLEYTYYVNPDSRQDISEIQITYTSESLKPETNSSFYKLSYYLKGTRNKLQISDRYLGYRLIDQTKRRDL